MTAAASLADIEAFLRDLHGEEVGELLPLGDGFWSSAYAYRVGGRDLVLRLGSLREGFEMDRAAAAFDRPGLPVPEVMAVGEALGRAYAVSARHHGRFLEAMRPDEVAAAGPAVERLLAALRSVPSDPGATVEWHPQPAGSSPASWRSWLARGLVDDPAHRVNGWRRVLAEDPSVDGLFRACERRIADLLDACPERRDLVHGDLLHRNVLISEDATRITAVFSWKCSVRGDFLFDLAWLTFWDAWHPGVAALDLWTRTFRTASVPDPALEDAGARHHCYELRIGAFHLGWNAWTGDAETLTLVADHTARVLERGPLARPV